MSKGFDTFRKLDDTGDDHLDSLLKTIIAHEEKEGKRVETDLITWRGMMTKVCPDKVLTLDESQADLESDHGSNFQ